MGLSGNLRATSKTKTAAKEKSAAKKPKTITATPGKTMFVKEFLNDHPEGNYNDANEAWTAAGFEGTISRTLVDKTRALLGLTGNLRETKKSEASAQEKAPYTGKKRGRKPNVTTSEKASLNEVRTQSQESARTTILLAVESEIDRLIFTVMGLGDLPEIETALRDARRRVCKTIPS